MNATTMTANQRVVLVVGASRGIGAAIAAGFAATGAQLVLAARDGDALAEVAERVRKATASTVTVTRTVDVTDENAVRDLLGYVQDRFGRLDVAVNNAGGSIRPPTPLQRWTANEFEAAIAVNLTGTFLAMKYELDLMTRTGGAVVNISSTAGRQPVAGLAGYVAGKYGVEGLTRVAALDNAAVGIRVNAVAPGPILTEQLAAAGPQAHAATVAAVPLGRLGTVEDVASAAVWLASPESSFITGTTLTIDGGRLAGTPPFRSTEAALGRGPSSRTAPRP